jgi:hypothetical protein
MLEEMLILDSIRDSIYNFVQLLNIKPYGFGMVE